MLIMVVVIASIMLAIVVMMTVYTVVGATGDYGDATAVDCADDYAGGVVDCEDTAYVCCCGYAVDDDEYDDDVTSYDDG